MRLSGNRVMWRNRNGEPAGVPLESDALPEDLNEQNIPRPGAAGTNPWRGWNGATAHPASPAGGGGPGGFRCAPSLEPAPAGTALHPNSPASRLAYGFGLFLAPRSSGAGSKKAPHPVKPRTLLFVRSTGVLLTIVVKILEDKINPALDKDHPGITYCIWRPGPWDAWVAPHTTTTADGMIGAVTNQPAVTGTLLVWTEYRTKKSKNGHSGYGRGTDKDAKAGNDTLEFHELCHQNDYLEFLANEQNLPGFFASAGVESTMYFQTWKQFESEIWNLPTRLHNFSGPRTDETGKPTKSQWERRKRRRRKK